MQNNLEILVEAIIIFYSFEALAAVFGWMKRSRKAIK